MLPSLLSEHLCSLRSGVERYAVSVIWALTEGKEGKLEVVGSPWFGRSIIRSRHQLHYQQAQVRGGARCKQG
jgi:exoribonuclease R